jgi:hypothetical protein
VVGYGGSYCRGVERGRGEGSKCRKGATGSSFSPEGQDSDVLAVKKTKDLLTTVKVSHRALDLMGKWSPGVTLSGTFPFSDSLILDGVLGVKGSIPLRANSIPLLQILFPVFCLVPTVGDFYPPPIATPLASSLGTLVPGVTLASLVTPSDSTGADVNLGESGPIPPWVSTSTDLLPPCQLFLWSRLKVKN